MVLQLLNITTWVLYLLHPQLLGGTYHEPRAAGNFAAGLPHQALADVHLASQGSLQSLPSLPSQTFHSPPATRGLSIELSSDEKTPQSMFDKPLHEDGWGQGLPSPRLNDPASVKTTEAGSNASTRNDVPTERYQPSVTPALSAAPGTLCPHTAASSNGRTPGEPPAEDTPANAETSQAAHPSRTELQKDPTNKGLTTDLQTKNADSQGDQPGKGSTTDSQPKASTAKKPSVYMGGYYWKILGVY